MVENLQKNLDEAAGRHGVPGAAIAVWAGGRLVEAATGVVNRNTGVETTPDSIFQVGSTTKVWTAALIMQLVEEGLVELDRPVRDYLPEFVVADGSEQVITVRHLLTHTGGFVGDLFEDTGRGDDCLGRYVEYLHGAGHVHAPGALFSYCNSGYCVLGALVARVRGTTWERAMRERLMDPLGVTHSALFGEEAVLFRTAAGHVGPEGTVHPTWQMPRSNAPAGSTMCLAPRELVRFGRMFLAGGLAEDGTRLLSEETVAAMRTPQVEVPGVSGLLANRWGLGFELFDWGGEVFGHDGGTIGQSTFWRVVPGSDFAVAMSVNGDGFFGLFVDVVLPLLREATGLAVPDFPVPAQAPQAVDPTPYTGRYAEPELSYEIAAADGGLEITVIPGEFMTEAGAQRTSARYVHHGGHSFITAESENGRHETVTFIVEDGRAAYLHNGRALPRA
ncbi:serine hydrolase [Streptosporangium sp. 'caverna']|uniref:serine hydrolase domain-containing protein n=1 Tax=Streptosporangium sp. 'caverna' TaxID=2202249 RepID=UPI000D7D5797|nr:serine hydrolase domain-containing protein [Streptosporangium sp. 'caverna']AWS46180.1 serine hydrolase [Streptosporangium sp. 'caverna']